MIPNKNTFCVAPFNSLYVGPTGNITPCCLFDKPTKYKFHETEDYYHSEDLNKVRNNLINGVKDNNCNACWKQEEAGGDSLRLILNRTVGKDITQSINNLDTKNIKSFDLQLGNLCNLKCVMCSPKWSSQILAEININQEMKKFYKHGNLKQNEFNWPKENDFAKWCEKFLPQSIHIKLTGGEPFINPWLFKTLESIPASQKEKCILHFTTNLTIINDKILNILKKFKETWISVSVDGIEDTFEYIRFGHTWNVIKKNIDTILNVKENIKLSINCVIQAPVLPNIVNMVNYFDTKKIKIRPIILTSPKKLTLSSLKEQFKNNIIKDLQNYKGYNQEFINVVKSVIKDNINHDNELAQECVHYLDNIDKIRNTNFKNIIPVDCFI